MPNPDVQLLDQLRLGYQPDYGLFSVRDRLEQPLHTTIIRGELYQILQQLANESIPPRESRIVDRLRFLGLASEVEFIEKTEHHLKNRLRTCCQKFNLETEPYTAKLNKFIEFAKAANKVRELMAAQI